MPIPKKQMEQWVRQQLFVDLDDGPFKRFVVRHLSSATKTGSVVFKKEAPENGEQLDDNWVEDFCQNVVDTCTADAEGIGGMQRYRLEAFHGDSETPNRFSVRMYGETDSEDDGISSEPPNGRGIIGQAMRHVEVLMRSSVMAQAQAMSALQRTNAQNEEIINKLLTEKFQNFEIMEQAMSQKDEREIKKAQAAQKIEMQEKLMEKVTLLLPMVVNKLSAPKNGNGNGNAQKLIPESVSPMEAQLASLADTISEDQLGALQKVFSTEQLLVFLDVFGTIKKKQESLAKDTQSSAAQSLKPAQEVSK